MYGPVFAISKSSTPDGITLSGYHIPGGTQLSVCINMLIAASNHNINSILRMFNFVVVVHISDVPSAPIL